MRSLFALLASVLLAGCSTVLSSVPIYNPSDPKTGAFGISYNLPRAKIGLRVIAIAESAKIIVCVREAIAVADEGHQYALQFRNSPFSADQFVVKRNELLGTLQEIDIKAQDQFDQFAINLGSSAGSLMGLRAQNALTNDCASPPAKSYELADIEFDPANPEEVATYLEMLNFVAMKFIEERHRDCGLRGKLAPVMEPGVCREYLRLKQRHQKKQDLIQMAWKLPKVPATAAPRCEVGFCYRHTLPHTMRLGIGESAVYSYTFQLPNSSPVVSLDLTRAIAITKTTKITFGRLGEITQIDVKKGRGDSATGTVVDGAEAVELALLPQAVVNAYFASLKQTTDSIANMFTSETTAIENRKKLIEAEVALDAVRKKKGPDPTMQRSILKSNGFVLAASNARPQPRVSLVDAGENDDGPQNGTDQPGAGGTPGGKPQGEGGTPGPGGTLPGRN